MKHKHRFLKKLNSQNGKSEKHPENHAVGGESVPLNPKGLRAEALFIAEDIE